MLVVQIDQCVYQVTFLFFSFSFRDSFSLACRTSANIIARVKISNPNVKHICAMFSGYFLACGKITSSNRISKSFTTEGLHFVDADILANQHVFKSHLCIACFKQLVFLM